MRRATSIGLIVVLVAVAVAVAAFFLRPPPSVKYAGSAAGVSAHVALRVDGPAPDKVTVDLGNGIRVVAARLP